MITKRQIIDAALDELGLASSTFDTDPSQYQAAIFRLDAMMATWDSLGIKIGYPLNAVMDLDDQVSIADSAVEAVVLNLAVKIAPSYGKTSSIETKVAAKQAYNALLIKAARPQEISLNRSVPRGAGSRTIDEPFIDPPSMQIDTHDGYLI